VNFQQLLYERSEWQFVCQTTSQFVCPDHRRWTDNARGLPSQFIGELNAIARPQGRQCDGWAPHYGAGKSAPHCLTGPDATRVYERRTEMAHCAAGQRRRLHWIRPVPGFGALVMGRRTCDTVLDFDT
jgi:hypothetical protein